MRLVIFTRYPEPGKVKTRLIPALGPEGAQRLHREMAELSLRQAFKAGVDIEIYFAGGNQQLMENWLGPGLHYRSQAGDTLGEKLYNASEDAFSEGIGRVVIIGTDCPGLTEKHINQAFYLLDTADLVLGPALDGGYYLLGLRRACGPLFEGINWGSDQVCRQTLNAARRENLTTELLEELADVDRPEDLPAWENVKRRSRGKMI